MSAASKLAIRSGVAGLFVAQLPITLGMFYRARIPVAHGGVEAFEVTLAVVGFMMWRETRATPVLQTVVTDNRTRRQ